ncbi:MAG: 4-(cytidine 5'-diphospho)-2-C-methyl-D-erythritol kinase [Caldiserica bacterium]|nr:4-(cytidine 5'-diphospho)-2-C-methyl-D-erythritol kinase [Caldisericota bacterium]
MSKTTYASFAKVNLFLELLGKRGDGFWEIETIFQTISLSDTLTFEVIEKDTISFSCNWKELENEENLAIKAARKLQRAGKIRKGVKISLQKRIPLGAGLGGGSSNAALTLKALNTLWEVNMGKQELHEIAASLGSDVSFFLTGGTCLGKGRGEIITPLPSLPAWEIFLIFPPFLVYTKDVYADARLPEIYLSSKPMQNAIKNKDKGDVLANLFNRLEETVFRNYPEIEAWREELQSLGFKNTLMSGSGPTLFGFLSGAEEAKKIREWSKKKRLRCECFQFQPAKIFHIQ